MADNPFTDWLKQIVTSGWRGEGMHSPEKVLARLRFTIRRGQQWDTLKDGFF